MSHFTQAIESLERAKRFAPKDFYVANFLGMAYYGANNIPQAVAEWKRALEIRPDPAVQRELDDALRHQKEEADYREGRSAHFQVRYNGAAAPASLVAEILRTLEAHFSAIESALNYTPREPIGVVLYTSQAYTDTTGAPDWSGAVTDTRYSHISVPTQGLTGINSDLSRTLKHELTHAFIAQKTRAHCPTWMQEGMAQRMEGLNASRHAAEFVALYDQRKLTLPLAGLEGSWMGMSGNQVSVAYPWAVSVIEYIVATGGMGDIERILDHMASEAPETSVKNVLHLDYSELELETIKYLRKTYVR
jgi:tetratricopeptide (TPR) repeat protein